MASTIAIAPEKTKSLKECVPHIMPFHIKHSGSAPVKTYFRPQPCLAPSFGVSSPPPSDSQETVVASDPQQDASNASSSSTLTLNNDGPPSESKHFVAAFRGRTVHGLEVSLPDDYAGVIFRPPSVNKPPAQQPVHDSGRRSRRRGRQTALEEDDEAMDVDTERQDEPQRILTPAYSFDKFALWHPDNAVDTSRDEYFRALSEWTKLGAVVSGCR